MLQYLTLLVGETSALLLQNQQNQPHCYIFESETFDADVPHSCSWTVPLSSPPSSSAALVEPSSMDSAFRP